MNPSLRPLNPGRVRKFAHVVGSTLAAFAFTFATSTPALAFDSSNIKLSTLAVGSGSPIGVAVDYLYSSESCRIRLAGPKNTALKSYPVRNDSVKARISTAGLPAGFYKVQVNCGKGARATSDPFAVLPKGEPLRATCDITDSGFSLDVDGDYTRYGIQISNRSQYFTAESVKLAVTWLDAGGGALASETAYVMDIAPGESVLEGSTTDAMQGAAAMRVAAVCDSTSERPVARLRGQAQFINATGGVSYPTKFGGTLVNPNPFTLSDNSDMAYVTRDAAGRITGGGTTYPDAFVPSGGTGVWSVSYGLSPDKVSSVEWVMDPEEE